MKKRILSMVLTMSLAFSMIATPVLAAEGHVHDETCGYSDGQCVYELCETEEDEDLTEAGTEEETEIFSEEIIDSQENPDTEIPEETEDATEEPSSEEDTAMPLESEETTPLLGSTFSVAATNTETETETDEESETLCGHGNDTESCPVCDLEEQIAALPALDEVQAMTYDEEDAVYAQASALADVYYDDLTADEQDQVSNIDALWDVLDYFSSGLTLTALSVDTTWYNSTDTSFTLYDAADLAGLASLVNAGTDDFSGKTIMLGNNINLNNEEWTPIGSTIPYQYYPFSGTFDGNGYTVSGLHISNLNDRQGLFGYISGATVKNLTVSGSVSSNNFVGGVVGYATNSTVIDCTNIGNVSGAGSNIGGVVGYAYNSTTVSGCTNSGDVSGTSNIGGVVGEAYNSTTVSGCTNIGGVSGTGSNIGGVVGYAHYGSITVSGCTNSGGVSGTGSNIGGVVGYAHYGSITVSGCANSGDVSGTSNIGGVAGYANDTTTVIDCTNSGDVSGTGSIGGVAGCARKSTVSNCCSSGDVINSGDYAGGVVGYVDSATVSNTYYLDTAASSGVGSDSSYSGATARTVDEFASGEVAYLLTGGTTDGTQAWYQNLDNGATMDSYPVLDSTHGTVYYGYATNCQNPATYSNTALSTTGHSYEAVVTDSTCTTGGYTTYTCSVCGDSYTADETEAKGHSWGATVYTWSDDGKSCTTTRTCETDSSHVEEAMATVIGEETKAATCTEAGETTYTAVFSESWASEQTKVVADISVTGHSYSNPNFTWSEDGASCTASFTCTDCGDVQTVTATVTSEVKTAATTTENGVTIYTATVTFDGIEYTATKELVDIPATGSTDSDDSDETGNSDITSSVDSETTTTEYVSVATASAETGDNSQIVLWLVVLLVSGVGAAGIAAYYTKRKRSR